VAEGEIPNLEDPRKETRNGKEKKGIRQKNITGKGKGI